MNLVKPRRKNKTMHSQTRIFTGYVKTTKKNKAKKYQNIQLNIKHKHSIPHMSVKDRTHLKMRGGPFVFQ